MSILWCGAEDINFPNGTGTMFVDTTRFRSGYGRCAILNNTATVANFLRSLPFAGGAVTSAWLTYRVHQTSNGTAKLLAGFGLSGTSKGLFVGSDASTNTKLALSKYDGSTRTQLAAESGTSMTTTGTSHRIDMQVTSYGASASVNVYCDSVLVITYSGDVTVSGMSNFDSVSIPGGANTYYYSEIAAADEDPRGWPGIVTLALTGAGATADWTNNTYTNINGTSVSDASPTYSDTNNQVQAYNVTNLPAGTFRIKAVQISARMAKSATPTVAHVQLGYNNGSGSSGAGTGAAKAVTTTYATYEQIDATNPITATDWQQSEINPLQLELTAQT